MDGAGPVTISFVRILRNPHVTTAPAGATTTAVPVGLPAGALRAPRSLHRLVKAYAPTRLVDVPSIAERTGLGRVLVKHELNRFGLPAFKIIGASWATYRVLAARYAAVHGAAPEATSFAALCAAFSEFGDLTLVTATDGNHGRAVARAAAWFGLGADIYMPAGTVEARVRAIESEGARVTVVDGDYDLAVATAAATASADRLVISDTSWPGYTEVPTWIAEGYATIFGEIDRQVFDAVDSSVPDAIVIPVGVGAFLQAALDHYPAGPPDGPVRIAVEPLAADCLYRSLEAGEPVTVPGPHDSMMAGMNCGTVSMIAWPTMRDRTDWAVAIEDAYAADAMRLLADAGLVVGETGAGTVGALLAIADASPASFADMGLGPDSTVVCVCTEGATDPVNYGRIVGTAP